jgi:glutamate racemase
MKPPAGRFGLYDSGIGGLTVLRALRAAGIDQDIVYFADQAHVPYGDKTDADIKGFLSDNLSLLASLRVDAVITACNTSCAVAQRLGWPEAPFDVLDLIANSSAALAQSPYRRVAVIATAATVRSGAYARAIGAAAPGIEVSEWAAPALVPLVERGESAAAEAREAVRDVVAGLPAGIDAVLYGCTHYPLLDQWFAKYLPAGVARIDPAHAQAAAARRLVVRRRIAAGGGTTAYYTNGDPGAFEAAVRRLGSEPGRVTGLIAP